MRIIVIKKLTNIFALFAAACCILCITACSSIKTSDDFINEYCKCAQSADDDIERHKCEVILLEKMAEQMKSARGQETQQEEAQSIIKETSQKLVEARKKCGGKSASPVQ